MNSIIELTEEFKPCYTWPSKVIPFVEYFISDNLKIFIIENIIHNYKWLKEYKDKITNTHFFFVRLGWYHDLFLWEQTDQIFNILKLNKNNFYFLCNCQEELSFLKKFNLQGDLINHNAFLDENLYRIKNIEKKYNAILTARLTKWKRHYLASKILNLALISGGDRHEEAEDVLIPSHVFNNYRGPLKPKEVVIKINESRVGLSLSALEGACYSSSEYLLCGIPVVSTSSKGGRDFWYDDYNSIICKDNPVSVSRAVSFFLKNKTDPNLIRNNHINLAIKQRIKFIKKLQEIFYLNNLNLNATNFYEKNKINKLVNYYEPKFKEIFN